MAKEDILSKIEQMRESHKNDLETLMEVVKKNPLDPICQHNIGFLQGSIFSLDCLKCYIEKEN